MRFTVHKHPKIYFGSLCALPFVFFSIGLGFFLYDICFMKDGIGMFVGGICFFTFLLFTIPLFFIKNEMFSEFTVHEQGITVHYPKKEEWTFLWNDLAECAIFQIHYRGELFLNRKLICFSKKILTKKDKFRLTNKVKKDILCVDYTDEIIFAVREYFPISLDVQEVSIPRDVSQKDLEE